MALVYEIDWGAGQSQALAMWVTACLLSVALYVSFRALSEIDESTKSRHTATHIAMSIRWESEEMMVGRSAAAAFRTPIQLRDAVVKAHVDNSDAYYQLVRVPNFFETISTIVEKEGLPIDVVRASWYTLILHNWDHWAPAIREMRDLRSAPTIWTGFEDLAGKMKDVG